MSLIALSRSGIYVVITCLSIALLGLCVRVELSLAGYTDLALSFVPLTLGVAGLTIVTLPLFLVLGHVRPTVFTHTTLFEAFWFLTLGLLWLITAADALAGHTLTFPLGCIYRDFPLTNRICNEFRVIVVLNFLAFCFAIVYFDLIVLYAITQAIRGGRSVWLISINEAATGKPINAGVPMVQTGYSAVPAGQYSYRVHPRNVLSTERPHDTYPVQDTPLPRSDSYSQQASSQGRPSVPSRQN